MAMSGESDPTSPPSPSSLKQKLKSSLRLPWIRHHSHYGHHGAAVSTSATPISTPTPSASVNSHNNKPRLTRTYSPTWLKTPEFKEKCRNLINRIGHGHGNSHGHGHGHRHRRSHSHGHGHHGHGHGRRHSADFRYDPSSYALNFDEGGDGSQFDDELPNFSARLPPSPTATTSKKITAFT